jgi:hypothetical protein
MKNSTKILSALSLAFVLSAGAVQANGAGWYTGVSGDLTWLQHSDTGAGVNVDLGYKIEPSLRLEGEVGYHNAPGKSGYADTYYFTYMANGYYDFDQFSVRPDNSGLRITPYLGAGIGIAQYHSGQSNFANTFHNHDTDFAYQGMAGVSFVADSMPNTDWAVGYRYTGAGSNDIEANNIEFGLRYHF